MSVTHRLSRVLGVVALAATLATTSTATAGEGGLGSRRDADPRFRMVAPPDDPPPVGLVGPVRRQVESQVVWRAGRLHLRGDVHAWSFRPVLVQRKSCQACAWRRHEVTWTGRKGAFRSVIGAPRRGSTFWRARVRAADGYAPSFSATWETHY